MSDLTKAFCGYEETPWGYATPTVKDDRTPEQIKAAEIAAEKEKQLKLERLASIESKFQQLISLYEQGELDANSVIFPELRGIYFYTSIEVYFSSANEFAIAGIPLEAWELKYKYQFNSYNKDIVAFIEQRLQPIMVEALVGHLLKECPKSFNRAIERLNWGTLPLSSLNLNSSFGSTADVILSKKI